MTALLIVAPVVAATGWLWWTSPTYRQQRDVWARARRDRMFARAHRIGRVSD